MNNDEFEWFVLKFGKDILRFCRMTAGDVENGDELYQDTMLILLKKKKGPEGTVKSRMWKAKKQLKEKLEAIGYDR